MAYLYSNKNTTTIKQLRERANAKKIMETESPAKHLPVPKFKPFTPPVPTPAQKKEMEHSFILAKIASLPGFSMLAPITADVVPENYKPKDYKHSTIINPLLSFTSFGYDKGAYSQLFTNSKLEETFAMSAKEFAEKYYEGSGTLIGLLTRMKSQLPTLKPGKKYFSPAVTEAELDFVLSVVPHSNKSTLKGEGYTIESISPGINEHAHPGAPYFKGGVTVADVYEETLIRASTYLKLLGEKGPSGLTTYFSDQSHAYEAVVMLSAKRDIYEREEYFTKSRPFFVFPGALRLIFSCITDTIKQTELTFEESSSSINAVGFSWSKGGARRLSEYIRKQGREPGLHAISWGDDQIWVVVLENKDIIVLNPDVMGMDMKIDAPTFTVFLAWLLQHFTNKPVTLELLNSKQLLTKFFNDPDLQLDKTWGSAILFMVAYLKKHPVLTHKHLMAMKELGLSSGANMTSYIDIMGSARLVYRVRQIPVPKDLDGVKDYMRFIVLACKETGFPIKPTTLDIQVITSSDPKFKPQMLLKPGNDYAPGDILPKDVDIGLKFLGMIIKDYVVKRPDKTTVTIKVPCMDPLDIVKSRIYSAGTFDGPVHEAAEKLAALLGSGVMSFADKNAYNYLKGNYEFRKQNAQVGYPIEEMMFPGVEDLDFSEVYNANEYPSKRWYARIFASESEREQFEAPAPKAVAQALVAPPTVADQINIDMEMDPFAEEQDNDLEDSLEVPDLDSDGEEVPPPPPEPLKTATVGAVKLRPPIKTIRVVAEVAPVPVAPVPEKKVVPPLSTSTRLVLDSIEVNKDVKASKLIVDPLLSAPVGNPDKALPNQLKRLLKKSNALKTTHRKHEKKLARWKSPAFKWEDQFEEEDDFIDELHELEMDLELEESKIKKYEDEIKDLYEEDLYDLDLNSSSDSDDDDYWDPTLSAKENSAFRDGDVTR